MTMYTFRNQKENGETEIFISTNKANIEREYKNCRKNKNNKVSSRQSAWDDLIITIDGEITNMENI